MLTQGITVRRFLSSLGSCTVVNGATSCDISFSGIKLGDAISNKMGSLSYQVSVDSVIVIGESVTPNML